MQTTSNTLWKQRLFQMHISTGIVFALLLYVSLFFGLFAIFLPYLQVWEKPSHHLAAVDPAAIDYEPMVHAVLADPAFPKNNMMITLPGNDPVLSISHRFAETVLFNPATGEKILPEPSHLAAFLNELHYGRPLNFDDADWGVVKFFGRILFGLLAVGVMAVIVSGVILLGIFTFKNRSKNNQARFSKWHITLFSWTFPVFFLIVLSGACMNIGLLASGPMAQMLTGGTSTDIDAVVGPVLFPRPAPVAPVQKAAAMLPIDVLLQKAQQINPAVRFQQIRLINWNDESAQIEFKGYNPAMPFLNGGVFNKPGVTLNARDGSLIARQDVLDRSWSVYAAEATFFLHFLFGVGILTRFFVAALMAAAGLAIGFGVLLWIEKKRRKHDESTVFYHWMEKLFLAGMIGIIPATGVLFVLQWLLPFDLHDRILWQQGLFYNAWLATLFWSYCRLETYRAAKEFLAAGGILFIAAAALHGIVTGFGPADLLRHGMGPIFGVDLGLTLWGAGLLYLALKLPVKRKAPPRLKVEQ